MSDPRTVARQAGVAHNPATSGSKKTERQTLSERYEAVRRFSEQLCKPLTIEDYVIQTMPDVSPAKWHLAHTTWFFETFVLRDVDQTYRPLDPQYEYLFNSYYNTVGEQYCRPKRGMLSRPTVDDVFRYRRHVDQAMCRLLAHEDRLSEQQRHVLVTGIHHEQQHQELFLTDIKHVFAANVLRAQYGGRQVTDRAAPAMHWHGFDGGLIEIGHDGNGFAYDNETPRHRVFIEPFEIASRLVTCGEYLEFMRDGGYQRPELWLSDGWKAVQEEQWSAPLYWEREGDTWYVFTLSGKRTINMDEPVCHVSHYEADAYAQWAGARLPREAEWEHVAAHAPLEGNFVESGCYHPAPAEGSPDVPQQLFGDVWEWTSSPYASYPGYTPPSGAMGEYNSKFMCNQMVLRGGSSATSESHIRRTYRNFFPPEARWQFAGIRLARDA